ncbi:hypothetical protein bcere0025_59880 [Bacillus cereus F65185]|nr:hypothetical protein bcere0025_59880 [Bacillus cereus F65185]
MNWLGENNNLCIKKRFGLKAIRGRILYIEKGRGFHIEMLQGFNKWCLCL